ncbi:hypothetical protein [Ferrimonas pelagia]|uniref:Uncharacterized protein n=1 Tax=Ferrimonas pelagia TaxID=1177826 RepID=A0ABP9FC94_9GAMM
MNLWLAAGTGALFVMSGLLYLGPEAEGELGPLYLSGDSFEPINLHRSSLGCPWFHRVSKRSKAIY